MEMKLRKCSCGGIAEIVDGEPTELGVKMYREYGLTPSRTYKAVCSSCDKSTASFPYGDKVKADWNRLNPLPPRKYVRVVRCKDCIYLNRHDCPMAYIERQTLKFAAVTPDFYCAKGADHEPR